jgi:CIC family chloride channel protein
MRSKPVTIHKDASFSEVMALFQETNILGFPVLADDNKLWGIITLQDIHRAQSDDNFSSRGMKVVDLAVEDPITVFPDEPIWVAIQKMSPRDLARLPVVSRDGSRTLCGIISRSDILRAYDVGIVRRQRGQIVEHQVELRKSKENGYVEFVLKEEHTCNNAMVKDLSLPDTINMVSIKRGGQILIPRGHTQLNVGDVITVYGNLKDIDGIRNFLNTCNLPVQPT